MDNKPKTRINVFSVACFDNDLHIDCNDHINFAYLPCDNNKHLYSGGLQCNFEEDTDEYKTIENLLCDISDKFLELNKLINTYNENRTTNQTVG